MGRHFEVRAKSMAATAAKKSAVYMRASKEIYMVARAGVPDPEANLALRTAIEKWKSQSVPRDVIDRAVKKAAGGDAENYESGMYEAFGPGNSYLIVETLSDNSNRAFSEVRAAITKKGGQMGSVIYNFTQYGVFTFKGDDRDSIEENLILGDVDVQEVSCEDGYINVLVSPEAFGNAREVLNSLGITEFETNEIAYIANDTITISDAEDKKKFDELLDMLDELQDVQNVYHNVER